jgi:hypothetical protein
MERKFSSSPVDLMHFSWLWLEARAFGPMCYTLAGSVESVQSHGAITSIGRADDPHQMGSTTQRDVRLSFAETARSRAAGVSVPKRGR